jgi:DNA-binding response OmpR family regulator
MARANRDAARIIGARPARSRSLAGPDLGVNAYVVKPVEFDKFVAAVTELGLFRVLLNEPPPQKG